MPGCSYRRGSDLRQNAAVARFWIDNGGNPDAVAVMTGIAIAESAGYADAVSPDCAYGLWQVLADHATERGENPSTLFQPSQNARYAVDLSFNGTRLAPWDTAYDNLQNAARRYPISQLEPNSPARMAMLRAIPELAAAGITDANGNWIGVVSTQPGQPVPIVGSPGGEPTPVYSLPIPPSNNQGTFPGFTNLLPLPNVVHGWDNVRQWLNADQVALHELDVLAMNTLARALGQPQSWG